MSLHQQRLTPTQQASLECARHFREKIAARAAENVRKVIPIVCLDKVQPITVDTEAFGPRIKSELEIAFGPLVHSEPPEARLPSIKLIVRVVAKFYLVPELDIRSQRRTADIVRPRQIAMYLCKTLTLKSLPEIARTIGGRDHTTALHAIRKMEALIQDDGRLADEIEVLKLHIRQAVLNQI